MPEDPKFCAECGVSFEGDPIPEDKQELFGGAKHFSKVIGLYSRDKDMTVGYRCPECSHSWPRPGFEGWFQKLFGGTCATEEACKGCT